MLALALLLSCRPGADLETGDTAGPKGIVSLPARPTWESAERDGATGLGWGDFDGDGQGDLVLALGNDVRTGPVAVHLGRDGGVLLEDPDRLSAEEHYFAQLAVGDVDGDGCDDAVVARYLGDAGFEEPGGADLYRGGPGGLEEVPAWSFAGTWTFAVALGDADLDGDLDLALATGEAYEGHEAPALLFENHGGTFGSAPAWTSADEACAYDVAFLDADLDGALDLACARSGSPHVLYRNAGGEALFEPTPSWTSPGTAFDGTSLDFGDVDGDGRPDLLVADNDQLGGEGVVRLFCGPTWAVCWKSPGPRPWSVASLVDVDGDGDLDAAADAWWGRATWWPAEGGVLAADAAWTATEDSVAEAFAWRDLDGAQEEEGVTEGTGLVAFPRGARVRWTDPPAAVGDGYASAGRGVPLTVGWARSRQPDLAVSNWDADQGSWLFQRD
jgi:hypothetical protein